MKWFGVRLSREQKRVPDNRCGTERGGQSGSARRRSGGAVIRCRAREVIRGEAPKIFLGESVFLLLWMGLCPGSRAWRWFYAWRFVARFPRLKPWVDGYGCRCVGCCLCVGSRAWRWWYAWRFVARFPRLKLWVDGYGCRCVAAVCVWVPAPGAGGMPGVLWRVSHD